MRIQPLRRGFTKEDTSIVMDASSGPSSRCDDEMSDPIDLKWRAITGGAKPQPMTSV